jgi:hypothetical protein
MTDRGKIETNSKAAEIEAAVAQFIDHYGKTASDFGIAKGFLSAAIGHAAVTMDDRAPLRDLLLAAADAAEKGVALSSRYTRPAPWVPAGGAAEVTQAAVGKITATLAKLHDSDPAADRAALNAAALRAGLIMITWHEPKYSAAAIRAFAGALKDLPTTGLQ